MTPLWGLVVVAACIGLYFAIRVRAARGRDSGQVSPASSADIARRADQQARRGTQFAARDQ